MDASASGGASQKNSSKRGNERSPTSVNPKLKQAMMRKAQTTMNKDKNTVVPFGGNFIKFM